jgi:hypothetical protein
LLLDDMFLDDMAIACGIRTEAFDEHRDRHANT